MLLSNIFQVYNVLMDSISSSYKKNDFDEIFKTICQKIKPMNILEIGILDGYSLNSFINHSSKECRILAVDLFEDYKYKNSNYDEIKKRFLQNKNVEIRHGNFFNEFKRKNNYDLIHIDISNDGDIFKFALDNYLPITNKIMILEGGSKERDSVEWMLKYNKPKINSFLQTIEDKYQFQIVDKFPSITIFHKDKETDLIKI